MKSMTVPKIKENFPLKQLNTFGIEAQAKQFVSVDSETLLEQILASKNSTPLFILGGGSNLLLTQNIEALVLHINLKGIKIAQETNEAIWITAQAGENWHEFVLWTLEQNYGGLENLSLIPGNVGTTPIQNIGAYGIEIKDVMDFCEGIHIQTLEKKQFSKEECHFSYRESIFKNELKGQYIITSVTFKLTKTNHLLHTGYGAIESALEEKGIQNPTIQDVSNAVISIRQSKLPDPKVLGNSGSFFKNPIISKTEFEVIQKIHPEIPFYKVDDTSVKVPAGWLIEQAGFKGKRFGDAGIHKNQALVLVNYGEAKGSEIWALAQKIQQTILEKFNIKIDAEVNVI
uniref:UDP-N-acetylmuramate dehydrogenase n=2 Tax=Flavobacterium sp. TaxID=239 RepID=UPI004048F691